MQDRNTDSDSGRFAHCSLTLPPNLGVDAAQLRGAVVAQRRSGGRRPMEEHQVARRHVRNDGAHTAAVGAALAVQRRHPSPQDQVVLRRAVETRVSGQG